MTVGFKVLGPVMLVRDGQPIELVRLKERALLGVLLANAGHVVTRDRIIDALWDQAPAPGDPIATLQVHISHLRALLEPGRPAGAPARLLVHNGDGYALAVQPWQIDAHVFETATHTGLDLLARGQPDAAAAVLRDAMALWRGDAYDGLRAHEFAVGEIRRLEECRLLAAEALAEAELARGRHAWALPVLVQLVAEHPLSERLRVLAMTALCREGRQGDALRSYEQARRLLARELGVDPGPELRHCHAQVLAHDPALFGPHPPDLSGV
jgi:DNA-binding SARP family transcriptional activator